MEGGEFFKKKKKKKKERKKKREVGSALMLAEEILSKTWTFSTRAHAYARTHSLSLSRSPAFVGFVAEAIVRMTVGQTQSCNTDQQNNQSGCRRIHQYTQQIITFFFAFFTTRVNRTGCIRAITNKRTRREGRKLVCNAQSTMTVTCGRTSGRNICPEQHIAFTIRTRQIPQRHARTNVHTHTHTHRETEERKKK